MTFPHTAVFALDFGVLASLLVIAASVSALVHRIAKRTFKIFAVAAIDARCLVNDSIPRGRLADFNVPRHVSFL